MATVNFRYAPTSGALSGASFEAQTERAFNELGIDIEDIRTEAEQGVDLAVSTANAASNTANNALQTAQSAETAANAASTAADAATSAANAASSAANKATDKSNQAYDLATDALAYSQQAVSSAETATQTANAASQAATAAQQTAQSAEESAQAALVAAARPQTFQVQEQAVDADAEYTSAVKYYVSNTESTNFPLAAPLYFETLPSSDAAHLTQRCWSASEGGPIYQRLGEVLAGEGGSQEEVSFGEWQSMGGGGSGGGGRKIGEIYGSDEAVPDEDAMLAQGGLISSASSAVPELYTYLQTEAGQLRCVTEDEWQSLSAAAEGVGGAWKFVLDPDADSIRLPDVRGDYAEYAGFDGLEVGGWHKDAIRNITGTSSRIELTSSGVLGGTGALRTIGGGTGMAAATNYIGNAALSFDASLVVPTANKNQPRAGGKLPLVKVGAIHA